MIKMCKSGVRGGTASCSIITMQRNYKLRDRTIIMKKEKKEGGVVNTHSLC